MCSYPASTVALVHLNRSTKESNSCLWFSSYDEAKQTLDEGFPKRVDLTFPDIPGNVTAAFEFRGEERAEPLGVIAVESHRCPLLFRLCLHLQRTCDVRVQHVEQEAVSSPRQQLLPAVY